MKAAIASIYNQYIIQQDKALFWKCKTFEELKRLMYQVVLGKVGSPNYGMERNSPENTDNGWWVNGDPRYELLKVINRGGLMTLNAEEGELTSQVPLNNYLRGRGVVKIDYHCSLTFMYPKARIHKLLDYIHQSSNGFDVILFDFNGPEPKKLITFPINVSNLSNGRQEIWSSTRYTNTTLGDGTPIKYGGKYAYSAAFQEVCNPTFFNKLVNSYYEIEVYDTIANRPAHVGLFKFLADGVKNGMI